MERLGLSKKWISKAKLIERYEQSLKEGKLSWDPDLAKLKSYSEGKNNFQRISDDMKTFIAAAPPLASDVFGAFAGTEKYFAEASLSALVDINFNEWVPLFAKATAYRYWSLLIQIEANHGSPTFNNIALNISRLLFLDG